MKLFDCCFRPLPCAARWEASAMSLNLRRNMSAMSTPLSTIYWKKTYNVDLSYLAVIWYRCVLARIEVWRVLRPHRCFVAASLFPDRLSRQRHSSYPSGMKDRCRREEGPYKEKTQRQRSVCYDTEAQVPSTVLRSREVCLSR